MSPSRARTLMVQGTGSSVGKSLLCLALCRLFYQEGYRVAPFKAQNMSLNAYVTPAGEEIAWAQAVQAYAAGATPTADMNPVLLKPTGHRVSQVVLAGKAVGCLDAVTYRSTFRPRAWRAIRSSLARLRAEYDVVVIEGAGSPAEVNLRRGDLVNMRVAREADAPVLLVGDVDRGGVFAALLGTLALLTPAERARVAGLVVNKFRGDPRLFDDGVAFLERRSRRPVLGVLPWIDADVGEEDAAALEGRSGMTPAIDAGSAPYDGAYLDLAVLAYPRMANFTDLDALGRTPEVRVRFVNRAADLGRPDALILPGSKDAAGDLLWLRSSGLADRILDLAAQGTPVAGLCGGFQMLGRVLRDPGGHESPHREVQGLGLLPVETTYGNNKRTVQTRGRVAAGEGPFAGVTGMPVEGYEIHTGSTRLINGGIPFLTLSAPEREDGYDGCITPGGTVWGTYLHGIFDNEAFLRAWVDWLRARRGWPPLPARECDRETFREREFDRLADWARAHLRLDLIRGAMGL